MGFADHSLILKNDYTLWGCGRNDYGQLGLGDSNHRYKFLSKAPSINNIKK